LVTNPDNSYLIAVDENAPERMTVIEIEEKYPTLNFVPFRFLSVFELVVAIVMNATMLFINSIFSILVLILTDCSKHGSFPYAIALHYFTLISVLPFVFLEKKYLDFTLMFLHLVGYTNLFMTTRVH